MKLATFNIYWLGNDEFVSKPESEGKERTEADWLLIARVISKLDADVIAFQEIVSLEELQKVFDLAVAHNLTSRSYRIHDQQGEMLGTGASGPQKVVLAYDEKQYALMAASPIFGGVGRLPFGLRVRNKSDGGQVLVIGVHFKSGQPLFDNVPSADKRKLQCQHLADWAAGLKENGNLVFPKPAADELIVILGDFNALYELEPNQPSNWDVIVESLDPLRDGHMNEWWWQKPLADPAGGGRTTSYVERFLIDFVMLSPSLKNRIVQQPTIYAYDQDAEITNNFATEVAYRVSDHRPVHFEIDVSTV
jgi:endonuclease/exonuclease/phosphatase family metal-dependent hydrolase